MQNLRCFNMIHPSLPIAEANTSNCQIEAFEHRCKLVGALTQAEGGILTKLAETCRNSPRLAPTYRDLPRFAKTCPELQRLTETCRDFSWLTSLEFPKSRIRNPKSALVSKVLLRFSVKNNGPDPWSKNYGCGTQPKAMYNLQNVLCSHTEHMYF